jgi:hypothetical protein
MRVLVLLLGLSLSVWAELPAPNANGVSAGHHIVLVRDAEGSNKFWTALGAQPAEFGTLKLVKFPGILVWEMVWFAHPRRQPCV